jgi:hypothetical protein
MYTLLRNEQKMTPTSDATTQYREMMNQYASIRYPQRCPEWEKDYVYLNEFRSQYYSRNNPGDGGTMAKHKPKLATMCSGV